MFVAHSYNIKYYSSIWPLSLTDSGPSLEEKMFTSCDLTADKKAQVSFKPCQALSELSPRVQVTAQFHSSTRARNWAQNKDDFNSAFIIEPAPEPLPATQAPPAADNPPIQPTSTSGEKKTCDFSPASFSSFSKLTQLAAQNFMPCLYLLIMRYAWFRRADFLSCWNIFQILLYLTLQIVTNTSQRISK